MKQFVRGEKSRLSDLSLSSAFSVSLSFSGIASEVDISCFGLDEKGRLSDERYMVFYNQTETPDGAVRMETVSGRTVFHVDLSRLSSAVGRLVFTASIDGVQTMRSLTEGLLTLGDGVCYRMTGADFSNEKALIAGEIYRKGEWRFAAVGSGFNGGLQALLESFGGEAVLSAPSAASKPPAGKAFISLEKKVEQKAPHLINLAKKLDIKLEKINLSKLKAKVAVVFDASGSMYDSYESGAVQELLERILLLALRFDDDGDFETWFFAEHFRQFPSVNLDNYKGYIDVCRQRPRSPSRNKGFFAKVADNLRFQDIIPQLGFVNNEAPVIAAVLNFYQNTDLPVYVLFVSDGGVHDNARIKQMITDASRYPVFWQFLGLGGSNYGILEKLDTLSGRYVDNANFFAVDRLSSMSDDELYDSMLAEFPLWLREIRSKGMIR